MVVQDFRSHWRNQTSRWGCLKSYSTSLLTEHLALNYFSLDAGDLVESDWLLEIHALSQDLTYHLVTEQTNCSSKAGGGSTVRHIVPLGWRELLVIVSMPSETRKSYNFDYVTEFCGLQYLVVKITLICSTSKCSVYTCIII